MEEGGKEKEEGQKNKEKGNKKYGDWGSLAVKSANIAVENAIPAIFRQLDGNGQRKGGGRND
ncbi:MAG: hypothetical protein FWG94_10235 [Oscillospiraceae bacterium]|nr:hypothetical protein [Oscillospiraceae bacterium]